jgi:hypothetical protein
MLEPNFNGILMRTQRDGSPIPCRYNDSISTIQFQRTHLALENHQHGLALALELLDGLWVPAAGAEHKAGNVLLHVLLPVMG